jgi:hypothetical protein
VDPVCLVTSFSLALFEVHANTCLCASMQSPTFAPLERSPQGHREQHATRASHDA